MNNLIVIYVALGASWSCIAGYAIGKEMKAIYSDGPVSVEGLSKEQAEKRILFAERIRANGLPPKIKIFASAIACTIISLQCGVIWPVSVFRRCQGLIKEGRK